MTATVAIEKSYNPIVFEYFSLIISNISLKMTILGTDGNFGWVST